MFDAILTLLPLADSDSGALLGFLSQVWLWFRVALGIGLVIFVHELGHFVAAKSFGVKCEKFYVGFDVPIRIGPIKFPRTLGRFTYGETEYGIGIIPLGGYVKMLGQDDDPRKAEAEAERIRIAGGDPELDAELDPRSYPAKPVWQRMIIISAGVVVNVVTGFMFAGVAFFFGVDYAPAVIGRTVTGGPAWEAGIEAGGQIVAVADLAEDDQLHFGEMMNSIFQSGLKDAKAKTAVVVRDANNQRAEYALATIPDPANPERRMIGVSSAPSMRLVAPSEKPLPTAVNRAIPDGFEGGTIVAVNGAPVDPESATAPLRLLDAVHSRPARPLELVVELPGDERGAGTPATKLELSVPVQTAREIGIRFAIGPVTTLIQGGPAAKAGLRVGDRITAINGQDDVDAYSLVGGKFDHTKAITLDVQREAGDDAAGAAPATETIQITPSGRLQSGSPVSGISDQIGLTTYGFAYRVSAEIAAVTADQAANNNLAPGDRIRELKVNWTDGKPPAYISAPLAEEIGGNWEISDEKTLVNFLGWVQVLPVGTRVDVKAVRGESGKVVESSLVVAESERAWHTRGLALAPLMRVQTAGSLGEAAALGFREGKRRMGDVFKFLGLLVRGKVKRKFVGGPLAIATLAADQTKKGTSKQLLFLTMLSMNLAILNFLPIPALDGGHMVFLTAELIRGKRVDEELEMKLTALGVISLLALMAFVFANDISRLFF